MFNRVVPCPGAELPPASACDSSSAHPRGYCSRCGWDYRIRKDGTMPKHHTQSDNIKPAPRAAEIGDPVREVRGIPDNG